jgi:hypothetical protein
MQGTVQSEASGEISFHYSESYEILSLASLSLSLVLLTAAHQRFV